MRRSYNAIGKSHYARKGRRVLDVLLITIMVAQKKRAFAAFMVAAGPIGNTGNKADAARGIAVHKNFRRVRWNIGGIGGTGKPNGFRNAIRIARIGRDGQASRTMTQRLHRKAVNMAMPACVPGGGAGFEKIVEGLRITFGESSTNANKGRSVASRWQTKLATTTAARPVAMARRSIMIVESPRGRG